MDLWGQEVFRKFALSICRLCVGGVVVMVISCGGGGGGGGSGNQSVVSITPADGETGVAVNTSLRVTLSNPLDDAQLSSIGISVFASLDTTQPLIDIPSAPGRPARTPPKINAQASPIPTQIRLQSFQTLPDETGTLTRSGNTVIFTPHKFLHRGLKYEVVISGISDGQGGTLPPQRSRFYTITNPAIKSIDYDGSGNITSYTTTTLDNQGNPVRIIRFAAAGEDGIWESTDDIIGEFVELTFDSSGQVTQLVNFASEGVDGIPFTPDDIASSWSAATYNSTGKQLTRIVFQDAGADGIRFTADDVPANHHVSRTYSSSGQLTTTVSWSTGQTDWRKPPTMSRKA